MAVLINGQVGESLGYQWGVKTSNKAVYEYPTMDKAKKVADSIPGASVVMREAYATEWMETL